MAGPGRPGRQPLKPGESSSQQRQAVLQSWANTEDWSARTAPARAALERKFLEQAGDDPKRAAALRKAHFVALGRKSGAARRAQSAMLKALIEQAQT